MDAEKGTVVRLPTPPGIPKGPSRPRKRLNNEDDLWLVSYSDLLTLLFCFFTLLLSVSTMDVSKMDGLKSQMDQTFSKNGASSQGLAALQAQIQEVAAQAGVSRDIHIRPSGQGLVVDLNARILFAPASAELSDDAKSLLTRIAAPLLKHGIEIQVEGHTDPMPIQNARFPSNWELSSARASGVVRHLIDAVGYAPERLRAVGLAATVPIDEKGDPLLQSAPQSDWTEAYLARQRRVSLVLKPPPPPPAPDKKGRNRA